MIMPELLTKYPDVALTILKDAKVACGTGKKPTILTQCPADRFCSLPTGELCIYGTKEINQTTQFRFLDFNQLSFTLPFITMIALTFIAGALSMLYWTAKK